MGKYLGDFLFGIFLIIILLLFGYIFITSLNYTVDKVRYDEERQISDIITNSNLTDGDIIYVIHTICTTQPCKDELLNKYILNKGESTNAD